MLPEEYGILTELLRELKQEIQDMEMWGYAYGGAFLEA